jgi:hypothetical protein
MHHHISIAQKMKLHQIIPLLLIAISFTGCSTVTNTPSGTVWYQAGKSDADIQRDMAGCRLEAHRSNSMLAMVNVGFFVANEVNKTDIFKDCMMAKGYSLVKTTNSPPPVVTGARR